MRAVVHDRYGAPDVLRLEEVERPVPKDDEILVKIHATTVNRTDCGMRSAEPFIVRFFTGLRRPKRKILGMELAGEVEAVGAAVTEFEVGDHVFGVKGSGAHAEFVCVRESGPLAHKPTGMTFEEAAAVCDGASLALACLRKADLRRGRSILIYGASGSVGTAGVQLAKYFGADVTAVCNTKNLELVQALQTLAQAGRHLHRNGPRVPVARSTTGPVDAADRRQEGEGRDNSIHEEGRPLPQGAHRGRKVSGGHRSLLPTRASGRGDEVRRNGAEDGKRRPDAEVARGRSVGPNLRRDEQVSAFERPTRTRCARECARV